MDDDAVRRYQGGTMTMTASLPLLRAPGRRAVGWWLVCVALLIAAMVTIGGLTRLTGSGLSITEWHPVTGVVPPLNEQAWLTEFSKYQRIPQYQLENRGMGLADFKAIYWWEWTHRLLGRLLGFVFLVPFLYFAYTRAIPRQGLPRMVLLFALGGLQGFVGWWMVESGLEIRVSVSQYRLAIHLGVAIILLGAILWTALEYLRFPPPVRGPSPASGGGKWAFAFLAFVYIQILLGALVAGLHGGLVYNTWPSMDGGAYPEAAFFEKPWWINFFENAGLAQFDHRIGAYLVMLGAVALVIASRRFTGFVRVSADALLAVTAIQIILGIATLLTQAPVALAAVHQATAVALFSAALWHAFERIRAQPAIA